MLEGEPQASLEFSWPSWLGEIHKGGWCPRPLQSQTSGGGSKYRGADGHNDNDRIQKTNFGFLPFSADAGRTHAVAPLSPQFDQTGAEQADGKTNKQNIRISSTIELKMPPSPILTPMPLPENKPDFDFFLLHVANNSYHFFPLFVKNTLL